jgi:hypothetical protein
MSSPQMQASYPDPMSTPHLLAICLPCLSTPSVLRLVHAPCPHPMSTPHMLIPCPRPICSPHVQASCPHPCDRAGLVLF